MADRSAHLGGSCRTYRVRMRGIGRARRRAGQRAAMLVPEICLPGVPPCDALALIRVSESNDDGLKQRELACSPTAPRSTSLLSRARPPSSTCGHHGADPAAKRCPSFRRSTNAEAATLRSSVSTPRTTHNKQPPFLASTGVTYAQLSDPNAGLLGDLRSPGLLVTVVLDAEGAVSQVKVGPFEDQSELSQSIERSNELTLVAVVASTLQWHTRVRAHRK